jgi:O-antigen/teichoic acid export membrane protein
LILSVISSTLLLTIAFVAGLPAYELLVLVILLVSLVSRQSYEVVIRSGILTREKAQYEVYLIGILSLLRFGLTLFISSQTSDLALLVTGLAIADLGTVAGGLFIGMRMRILQPGGSTQLARSLLLAALPLGISMLLSNSSLYVDTMILEGYWGNHEVGLFAAAYRPITMAAFIIIPLLWPLLPQLVKRAQFTNPVRDISQSIDVLLYIVLGPAIWVALYSGEVLRILFGTEFMPASITLSLLAITPLLRTIAYLCNMGLVAAHRSGLILIATGTILGVNLALDFIFIPSMGNIGAGWATLFTEVVGTIVGLIFITRAWKDRLVLKKYWAVGLALAFSLPCYFLPLPIALKVILGLVLYLIIGIVTGALPLSLLRRNATPSGHK